MPQKLIRRISLLSTVMAFAVTVVASGWASAAEGNQHIAITPSSADITVAPGKSFSDSLAVINQGNDSFKVKASVAPYHVEGINYDPLFTQLPGTVDASKWVKLSVSQDTTLTPNKLLHIDYTVQVPAGTEPGGYYAVIFAETAPVKNNGGVVAHNRVGEILYLTVAGKVQHKGSVSGPALSRFNVSGKLAIPTLVSNTGGVHFKTTVTANVKNIFGKKVFSQHEDRYVLPQTERQVTVTWENRAPIGIYQVSRQATTPSGTVKLPAHWVVMVQPWVLVAALIALVALVSAIARWLQTRRKHR